jgi:hypothetical protein
MTREDIIRMAFEAGFTADEFAWHDHMFDRFAALVAAAERVKLRDEIWDKAMKLVGEAAKLEREACAKVCEQSAQNYYPSIPEASGACTHLAAAIRARGQA